MNHTDPIADLIIRIHNAIMANKKSLLVPLSKIKVEIVKILKNEGYIADYKVDEKEFPPSIQISLKYLPGKKSVIEGIKRISKPGKRVYAGADHIPQVLDGYGVAILSTSQGLATGKECKQRQIGGEILMHIW